VKKYGRGASRVGGFPDLSELALCYRRKYGTKSLQMVRYGFHPNAPYSTEDFATVEIASITKSISDREISK
jgi:hypothetical protein